MVKSRAALIVFISLLIPVITTGCFRIPDLTGLSSRKMRRELESGSYAEEPMEYAKEEAPLYDEASSYSEGEPPPEPSGIAAERSVEAASVSESTKVTVPTERKRIRSGYAEILVDDVEQSKGAIGDFVETRGGYVESAYQGTLVIRIPAELFDIVMNRLHTFGEVRDDYVETFDVTEYYQDLDTRLSIAERARRRLYTLLEKTEDVEERVLILREIRRLTEEIERITIMLESIKKQIRFSRITINLVSRLEEYAMEIPDIPFPWISRLDPLYPSIQKLKGKVVFPLDDEYAVFEKEQYFRAESADLVRVRIGSLENTPEGDSDFWQQALLFHLEPYYTGAEPFTFELLKGAIFESKDTTPFYYGVGVHTKGRYLYVVEIFFPDRAVYLAKKDGILASMEKFALGRIN